MKSTHNYTNILWVFLLFMGLTFIVMFPLVKTIRTGVPVSTEGLGPQDALMCLWAVSWDLHKFKTGVGGFFDANIYFPVPNTLAYSEHFIGEALLALPFSFFITNPILLYNIVLLSSFVLSGVGMYLLALYLTGNKYASIIAGIIFSFFPYHYTHLSRLQLQMMQWIPFMFLFLHRFTTELNYKNIIMSALFFALTFLSCMYYGVYTSLFVLLFFLWFLLKKSLSNPKVFIKLSIFALLIILIIIPVHLPYFQGINTSNFKGSLEESIVYSADVFSYITAPKSNKFWGPVSMERPWIEGATMFFGVLPVILGILGIAKKNKCFNEGLQKAKDRNIDPRYFYVFVVISAFLLSLGPIIHINGREIVKGPYIFLYNYFPGFSGLRAPNRIGIFIALGIAVLAAFGVSALLGRIKSGALKMAIGFGLAIIIILEYSPKNLNAHILGLGKPSDIPPVYKWLSKQKDTPIVEYPFLEPQIEELWYMYYSVYHWQKMVNGYSRITPDIYIQAKEQIKKLPAQESVQFLKRMGVRYLIIHTKRLSSKEEADRVTSGISMIHGIKLFKQFGDDFVYEVKR